MQRIEAGPGINPSAQRDNLRTLLQSEAYETDISLGQFHQALGHIRMPESLEKNLDIPNLSLSQITPTTPGENPPVLFFIGRREGRIESTIELAQVQGDLNKKGQPIYLRIAGVDKESKRVVAATFNCLSRNLTRVSIGVNIRELIPNSEAAKERKISPSDLAVSSPTKIDNPYETAGFITPEMLEAADPDMKSALQIQVALAEGTTFINFGTNASREKRKKINEYARYLVGLYGRLSSGIFTAGLKRGETRWEVVVPSRI